jgi:hypothetical protein
MWTEYTWLKITNRLCARVNTGMGLTLAYKAVRFLTVCATVSFLRRTPSDEINWLCAHIFRSSCKTWCNTIQTAGGLNKLWQLTETAVLLRLGTFIEHYWAFRLISHRTNEPFSFSRHASSDNTEHAQCKQRTARCLRTQTTRRSLYSGSAVDRNSYVRLETVLPTAS